MEKNISNNIDKYVLGISNRKELEDALPLLEDPYNHLDLRERLFALWDREIFDENAIPREGELSGILSNIHQNIDLYNTSNKNSKLKRLVVNLSKIAIILLIGVVIGVITISYNKEQPNYYTSVSPKGSISQLRLPDSTLVYLNSDSEIKYSINGENGEREVFLKGEAWFMVEKNNKKPFVVHTSIYDINVLGTEFNVKAYPEEELITTTLENGSIKITSGDNFRIKNDLVLNPKEQLVYNRTNNILTLKEVNTKQFTSWKENKLIFINMSLKELITLLERKYGVDIEVADESILDFHYDGTIKNESILDIMKILQETLPMKFEIRNQKILITKTN